MASLFTPYLHAYFLNFRTERNKSNHCALGCPDALCVKLRLSAVIFRSVTVIIIIIISNLSNERSKASSKMIPPHSAI